MTQIVFTKERHLSFLVQQFKAEILKSLDYGILLDLYEVYTQFVAFFSKIFDDVMFSESEFRKAICQFVEERAIPRLLYK